MQYHCDCHNLPKLLFRSSQGCRRHKIPIIFSNYLHSFCKSSPYIHSCKHTSSRNFLCVVCDTYRPRLTCHYYLHTVQKRKMGKIRKQGIGLTKNPTGIYLWDYFYFQKPILGLGSTLTYAFPIIIRSSISPRSLESRDLFLLSPMTNT